MSRQQLESGCTDREQGHQRSIAISLKRIADRLDAVDVTSFGNQLLDIAYRAGLNFRGSA